ncbi:MAG: hypothetical protein HC822_15680 [Oscillochloris sp.]|nr:hypothetical protein [Oscillochloris sp.]
MATMTDTRMGDWRLWGGWGLAFLGFPLGGLAGQAVSGGVTTPLEGLLGGAAAGAVIGLTQWLVLRGRTTLPAWWIGATAAGMGLGLGASIALFGNATADATLLLRGGVTGAAIGLAQFGLLRTLGTRALIWPPLIALGWAMGWMITRAAGVDLSPNWPVFGSTGAWGFQLLTGLALAWIMRDSVKSV